MPMTELIYESDPDDPDWREVASDEESQGDGDKSREDGDDEEDVVESGDDGEKSEDDGKTLNKEQEEVLRSKPSVFVLIEELEKIRAPLSADVAEEISLATEQYPQIGF
ncbi:unnamed protein product [Arabidopsis arenosa]|uniref:Uncharacterized protein n=1 Tax=Arabidopsis arenosa TaxID=38785 RepID=A0A8S2ACE3_ARAAE|nr:unnamed protein product [Arabidopsis arenosa]